MKNTPRRFRATLLDCLVDSETTFAELTMRLELEFGERLDTARLEKAVDLTLDAEPVLGCRFVDNTRKPFFERLDPDKCTAFLLANSTSEYGTFKYTPIDHRTGPQISVCLWHSPEGDRLLLKVSHQVADAAGVKDIVAMLSGIYRRLSENPAYRPILNVKERRSYWQVVRHVPVLAYPRIFLNFVNRVALFRSHTVHTLSAIDGPREPLAYVGRFIPSSRASALAEYCRSHSATLNDIFLAACLRGLVRTAQWDGRSHLSLTTTIDMRRYIPSGRAGGVANLSTVLIHGPDLGTELGQDFGTTLDKVTKITGYGKTHWIGFDLLFSPFTPLFKVMPHAWAIRRYNEFTKLGLRQHAVDHGFTNTGPIEPESVNFGIRPSMACILPPQNYPPLPFVWSLSGFNGTLTLLAGAYPTQKDTIGRFFDAVLKELPA